jgi:hypothetical protein
VDVMSRIVYLLEEASMQAFLETFLPRAFPGLEFLCIPHEGKGDLEKSIPRKLRAWREPGVRFVVMRDNDGADCRAVKRRLRRLCQQGRRGDTLVRIPCQELEAWYFGDPDALAEAFGTPELRQIGRRRGFRDPDRIVNPAEALQRLVPDFQKISGARRMGGCLCARNRSKSFQVFLDGLRPLAPEAEETATP